jgi:hypothetical protein
MSRLSLALVVLVGCLVLHLVEEIATGFRRRFPLGEMPRPIFIGVNAVLYSYAAVMIGLSLAAPPVSVAMAWPFAAAMALNGVGHLGIMLVRRAYFPGGGTALPLLAAATYVLVVLGAS